jgi:hypothetical protein
MGNQFYFIWLFCFIDLVQLAFYGQLETRAQRNHDEFNLIWLIFNKFLNFERETNNLEPYIYIIKDMM